MSQIKGTNVSAPVVPNDTSDIYPSHLSIYGYGGWREVADATALAAIPVTRLANGCIVFQQSDSTYWQWNGASFVPWTGGGSAVRKAAFGFFDSGLYLDNELLGSGTYSENITFPSVHSSALVTSLIAATATAVFEIVLIPAIPAVVSNPVGTITFAAGSRVGVVAWTGGTFNYTAGDLLQLKSPSPADLTLGYVTGLIYGDPV